MGLCEIMSLQQISVEILVEVWVWVQLPLNLIFLKDPLLTYIQNNMLVLLICKIILKNKGIVHRKKSN